MIWPAINLSFCGVYPPSDTWVIRCHLLLYGSFATFPYCDFAFWTGFAALFDSF